MEKDKNRKQMGVKLRNEKTKSKFEKIVKILCAMLLAAIQIVGYSFSNKITGIW